MNRQVALAASEGTPISLRTLNGAQHIDEAPPHCLDRCPVRDAPVNHGRPSLPQQRSLAEVDRIMEARLGSCYFFRAYAAAPLGFFSGHIAGIETCRPMKVMPSSSDYTEHRGKHSIWQ